MFYKWFNKLNKSEYEFAKYDKGEGLYNMKESGEVELLSTSSIITENQFKNSNIHKGFGKKIIEVGKGCFSNCDNLKIIAFPNLKEIKEYFAPNCDILDDVYLPKLERITGRYAFYTSYKLRKITCYNLKEIGDGSFLDCNNLTEFKIKNSSQLTKIERDAFKKVKGFQKFYELNLNIIRTQVFSETNVTSLKLPITTEIEYAGFGGCQELTSIELPILNKLGPASFYNCKSLKKLDLPLCINIGNNAFQNCSELTELNISKIENLGSNVFYSCKKLNKITFKQSLRAKIIQELQKVNLDVNNIELIEV